MILEVKYSQSEWEVLRSIHTSHLDIHDRELGDNGSLCVNYLHAKDVKYGESYYYVDSDNLSNDFSNSENLELNVKTFIREYELNKLSEVYI